MSGGRGGPTVTVGIPTFNRPEGLRETLKRITNQTYRNLEIIVSDNCSNDEAAVRQVIHEFSQDPRLRYVRQEKNLGSVLNFHFLVKQAKGDFFIWAADDDEVELTYVEKLVNCLSQRSHATIAMSGYDVNDTMANPPIRTELTRHLYGLKGATAFERLKKYILQPDHLGKSRLAWGMFPTGLIRKAFADCIAATKHGDNLIWGDIPMEFRMLAYGQLEVVDEILFHVNLLPSSDGKQGFSGAVGKLFKIIDRSVDAQRAVVRESDLTTQERKALMRLISWYKFKSKLQVFGYYGVIGRFPWLARWVKKIVFWFT